MSYHEAELVSLLTVSTEFCGEWTTQSQDIVMDFFIVDRWAHTHFYSLSLFEKEKKEKKICDKEEK